MIKNILSLFNFQRILLFIFLTTIFLHFLKDTYIQYYFFLCLIFTISFIYLFFQPSFRQEIYSFQKKFLLFLFFLSFVYVAFISLLYQERWDHNNYDLLISYGRLFIAPMMFILIFGLTQNINDIKRSLDLYFIIFILAFLSILLQNFVGHLLIFGHDIYGLNDDNLTRYGIIGYSSIIGSVSSYGVCFSTATFIIFFNSKLNSIFKIVFITSIFIGAVLTMSKAAFINIFICLFIMSMFYKWNKNKYIVPSIIILLIITFFLFETFRIGTLGLYINTTGHEVTDGLKNNEHYLPILERVINRVFYKYDAEFFTSVKDFIFGIGVFGGGGVLVSNNPGTYHNSYLDIYTIGGIYYISIIVTIFTFSLYHLFKLSFLKKDTLALVLLLSNSVLFFNMLFFNGALFHPIISFPFWVSLVYIYKYNSLTKNTE